MATEAGHSSKDFVEPDQVPRMFVSFMMFCPYTERINVVLNIKCIPSHMLNVIESRGNVGDFLKKNGRKIPFLKCGDNVIYDSLLAIDFIDQQYPEPPLWDCRPAQKMLDKLLIESFAKVEAAVYNLYMTTREVKKENFEELVACLTPFEVELVKRGSKYFGGDEQNIVDVMIYPWFVFLDVINPYSNGKLIFPFDVKFPKLAEWKASFADLAVPLDYPVCLAKQIQLIKSEIFCTSYLKSLPKFNF